MISSCYKELHTETVRSFLSMTKFNQTAHRMTWNSSRNLICLYQQEQKSHRPIEPKSCMPACSKYAILSFVYIHVYILLAIYLLRDNQHNCMNKLVPNALLIILNPSRRSYRSYRRYRLLKGNFSVELARSKGMLCIWAYLGLSVGVSFDQFWKAYIYIYIYFSGVVWEMSHRKVSRYI